MGYRIHYSVVHFLDYSRTAIIHYRTMTHISGKLVRLFGLQSNENVMEIAHLSDLGSCGEL